MCGAINATNHIVRVKCSQDDTVGDLKKLIAAQTGTDSSKIQLKKWCVSHIRSNYAVRPHPTNVYLVYSFADPIPNTGTRSTKTT